MKGNKNLLKLICIFHWEGFEIRYWYGFSLIELLKSTTFWLRIQRLEQKICDLSKEVRIFQLLIVKNVIWYTIPMPYKFHYHDFYLLFVWTLFLITYFNNNNKIHLIWLRKLCLYVNQCIWLTSATKVMHSTFTIHWNSVMMRDPLILFFMCISHIRI